MDTLHQLIGEYKSGVMDYATFSNRIVALSLEYMTPENEDEFITPLYQPFAAKMGESLLDAALKCVAVAGSDNLIRDHVTYTSILLVNAIELSKERARHVLNVITDSFYPADDLKRGKNMCMHFIGTFAFTLCLTSRSSIREVLGLIVDEYELDMTDIMNTDAIARDFIDELYPTDV